MKKLVGIALVASLAAGAPVAGATQPTNPGSQGNSGNDNNKPYSAPGQFCKGMSKKHIAGQKGTPFSQCVTAMAKLQKQSSLTPQAACASLKKGKSAADKKAGKAAFKQCVQAGNNLRQSHVSS